MRLLSTQVKAILLFFSTVSCSTIVGAQTIDPGKDAIPEADAVAIHSKYKGQARSKASEALYINTDQMLEICNALKAKGITNVSFQVASLRKQDVAKYKAHHPELSTVPDKELNKKHILIIRVPNNLFDQQKQGMGFKRGYDDRLFLSLQSINLIQLDKPYNLPNLLDYMYLELSIICPPPNVCN